MEIPGYRLLVKCGRGAAGEVWLAEDAVGRRVALKTVEKSGQYEREFAGLRSFAHLREDPHLIRVFHVEELPDRLFYTMEMADPLEESGPYRPATLANVLKLRGRLNAEAASFLARELLSGVAALHGAGLIHRDIKPENLLFVNGAIKLSDLGLLRAPSPSLSVGGTLGFIPPERLAEASGCRSPEDDLYALGKTIYCAWSGNLPEDFPAIPAALLDEPGAKKLNAVLNAACAGTPGVRFRTAGEFAAALTHGVSAKRRLLHFARKTLPRPAALFAVAALLAFAAVMTFAASGRGKTAAPPPPPAVGALPETEAPGEYRAEFSLSDGSKEGTVLYAFAEPSPEVSPARPAELPHGCFTDPQYWQTFGLVNVRREYQQVRWDQNSQGMLELRSELPRAYWLASDLDISGAPSLEFGFIPADRKRALVFRLHHREGALRLSVFRGGAASGNFSAAAAASGRHQVEFLRSERGLRMSVDGKPVFDEPDFPPGGHLRVSGRCGKGASVTLENFRLDGI